MDKMTPEEFLDEWNNSSDKVLVHTSGSTGKPKPMMAEKSRMMASARITCDFLGLKPDDVALLCMPLDYIAGKMMVVRSIERKLQLINVTPSNHPLASITKDTQIDFAAMVPSQVFGSLSVSEERHKLMCIKNLIIGGGAINEEMEKELSSFPNNVWSTYGMTETLSHIALRRIGDCWYTPFDGVNISLSNEGCLIIDAPEVCAFPLTTNDIAEIHPDDSLLQKKRFRIRGRKDNVICSGGIKLQAEEIESTLRPYINVPFCISKRADKKFGEVAVLVIQQEPHQTYDFFNNICNKVLSKYCRPKDIVFVDSIPMTETGKIRRAEVQSLVR